MRPLRLYIKDFMCYDRSYINLEEISSALIIGRKNNSDLVSNAAGKSTIFKTIEYALFNYSEDNLDSIVRDDAEKCSITLDFVSDDVEYRVVRTRGKKGSTDVSLFERIAGSEGLATHSSEEEPINDKNVWKDISSRRASDTEKDLEKILKINIKLFRLFVHFVQNDFSGLTSATPEKRKSILKEALNLAVYSKLEKAAKEKSAIVFKEIDKKNILLSSLNDSKVDRDFVLSSIKDIDKKEVALVAQADEMKTKINSLAEEFSLIKETKSFLEKGCSELKNNKKSVENELVKIKKYEAEQSEKKSSSIKVAKSLIEDIKQLCAKKNDLEKSDFASIDVLEKELEKSRQKKMETEILVKGLVDKNKLLALPMPDENFCKHCRQGLSQEHKDMCGKQIEEEVIDNKKKISSGAEQIAKIAERLTSIKTKLAELNKSKADLINISTIIDNKNKELVERKSIYNEYSVMLEKTRLNLKDSADELEKINSNLDKSSQQNIKELDEKMSKLIQTNNELTNQYNSLHKSISSFSNEKAVLDHKLKLAIENEAKIVAINEEIRALDRKYKTHLLVVRAYSSKGIPNIIINSVLEELQIEANNLLNDLKPGLQLSFCLEKQGAKDDEVKETLDIEYNINGRDRTFGLLSGAQKFVVNFCLKLGLSFLLQKMSGVDIKFLLLDEVDQSLDKASVDAFADIVKFFEKDYKIIVITHNDRLKDKFEKVIVVNQNLDLISRATTVSDW